jgi:hypothetical protein
MLIASRIEYAALQATIPGKVNVLYILRSFQLRIRSLANFVGAACPGAGRGRRLPQRIINTSRRLRLAASLSFECDLLYGRHP